MDEVEILLQKLNVPHTWPRLEAAWELVEIGGPAVIPLIEKLRDEKDHVRWTAAEALGKIGDARAVIPLIERLDDRYWQVRKEAAKALEVLAGSVEIDFGELRASLKEFVACRKNPDERESAKRWATSVYAKIARNASKWKGMEMANMLPARIKPPKKPGLYRARRVSNG